MGGRNFVQVYEKKQKPSSAKGVVIHPSTQSFRNYLLMDDSASLYNAAFPTQVFFSRRCMLKLGLAQLIY
jgi:hypothetical protein